ncbi:MAG: hypothetical protein NVS1B9_07570 [Solirubrobacteraceae bacterium]
MHRRALHESRAGATGTKAGRVAWTFAAAWGGRAAGDTGCRAHAGTEQDRGAGAK